MQKRILVFLLSIISVLSGVFLIILSFFFEQSSWKLPLLLGLGCALLPAGIFAILSDISFSTLLFGSIVGRVEDLANRQIGMVDNRVAQLANKLDSSLDSLSRSTEYLSESNNLGIVRVHRDRRVALEKFLPYLNAYLVNYSVPNRSLIIVASSMKGIIEKYPDIGKMFTQVIETAVKTDCDTKVLLTHPAYSRYRETQESRQHYDIAKEILHAISWLETRGLSLNHIKVYKGTPTTFMIATNERMLLNFYPYQTEAFNCFCLEVQDTGNDVCIYRSFYDNHFLKPWTGEPKDRDHYLQTNSLSYMHQFLDGPVSNDNEAFEGMEGPFGDFFVIDDEGTFYLAVNIRGLKREIVYDRAPDGSQKTIQIGDELEVKLLTLRAEGTGEWLDIGKLHVDPDHRSGFWEATIRERSFKSLSMLGLFDTRNENAFLHKSSHSLLKDKPLPMLYKWLTYSETEDTNADYNTSDKTTHEIQEEVHGVGEQKTVTDSDK